MCVNTNSLFTVVFVRQHEIKHNHSTLPLILSLLQKTEINIICNLRATVLNTNNVISNNTPNRTWTGLPNSARYLSENAAQMSLFLSEFSITEHKSTTEHPPIIPNVIIKLCTKKPSISSSLFGDFIHVLSQTNAKSLQKSRFIVVTLYYILFPLVPRITSL